MGKRAGGKREQGQYGAGLQVEEWQGGNRVLGCEVAV